MYTYINTYGRQPSDVSGARNAFARKRWNGDPNSKTMETM